MGESKKSAFCLNFDNTIRLEFHGATITSDAGLLAYRQLDHALGITQISERNLFDIRPGKNTRKWTRLSCHDFSDNQVRFQLFALAYNLGNFLRRVALPRSIRHLSLTTLRDKLIKIGAKVISHARYTIFQMAEVAVPKEIFEAILEKIDRLRNLALKAV
jgi:hypothetical protein